MAQPASTFDTHDMVGIREDLRDVIYNVDPDETPFLTRLKKVKAKQHFHEWQTDSLRASAANAHIEGDDIVPNAITATTRVGNYCQDFRESATIPDDDTYVDKAGRAKEMAYQIRKKLKEVKLDVERALFLNNARDAGSSTTARELAGAQTWLATNTSHGASGSAATGNGTDTRTEGTDRALTQSIFDTVAQSCWDNAGGQARDVYLSSGQMNTALGFTGNNNQRATVKASEGQTINVMDVYVTPWGTFNFIMSRECPATEMFLIDPKMWSIAELVPMRNFELAKTGTSHKRGMQCVKTLVCHNEAASGMIADLS